MGELGGEGLEGELAFLEQGTVLSQEVSEPGEFGPRVRAAIHLGAFDASPWQSVSAFATTWQTSGAKSARGGEGRIVPAMEHKRAEVYVGTEVR